MKSPLPPMSASGWSSTRSPSVVIPRRLTSLDGYNAASSARTCSACHSASADSRVAIVSRRGADGLAMGRERFENGGRPGGAERVVSRHLVADLSMVRLRASAPQGCARPAPSRRRIDSTYRWRRTLARRRRGERARQGSDASCFLDRYDCALLRARARAARGADVDGGAVARPRDLPPDRDRPAAAARRLRRQRDDAPATGRRATA